MFHKLQETFDRVRHQRLFKMLENIGLDDKDYRIIYHPYHLQKTTIKLQSGLMEWTEINLGVRKGCAMAHESRFFQPV